MAKMYATIARWAFYALILLVPILYLPWTVDALEVNKQTLVLILTSVVVIAWLGMMVANRQFILKKSWLFLAAAVLLLAIAASSALSLAPYTSWVGAGVQEYTSFLSVLAFLLLFFVGAHFLHDTAMQRMVWALSFLASGLVSFHILLASIGLQIFNSNLIGTPNALGVYLVTMSVLGAGLWLVSADKEKQRVLPAGALGIASRVGIVLTMIAALVVTLGLDYWIFWVALLIGMGVIFTFALVRAEEFPHTSRFVLPMILFVVALLFLFLPSFLQGLFSVEVSPSYKASFEIARETLADTSWLFGSGPGTFVHDYAKFRIEEINQTSLWDVRFDRSGSHMLTLLATTGTVGLAAFLVIIGGLFALGLRMLITEQAHDEWKMTFITFSGWLVLTYFLFVYSSNFTLLFLFWLLSAILLSQTGAKLEAWKFSKNPRFGLLTAFLFVLVNVGLLTVVFVSVSRYAAEIAFAQAVNADQSGSSVDEVVLDLDRAARLNRLNDLYYRNLGHALLVKTSEVINDPDVDPDNVRTLVATSINAAKRATELSQANVVNWSLLGDIYRDVAPIVTNAEVFAIASYEKAIELAPSNPKYRVSLGRAYLVQAQQLALLLESEDAKTVEEAKTAREDALANAVTRFEEAIDLKNDYAPAHYYLALAYERQGNLSDAIARMEAVRQVYPNDIGVSFQLGLLYLKQGKTDMAQEELERSLEISPNYSNARWYLATIYEQNGDTEAAIEQLEKIQVLNPNNSLIEQRLERLKSGSTPATTIPEPIEEGEDGLTTVEDPLVTEEEES